MLTWLMKLCLSDDWKAAVFGQESQTEAQRVSEVVATVDRTSLRHVVAEGALLLRLTRLMLLGSLPWSSSLPSCSLDAR